jgi:hypothetical protein
VPTEISKVRLFCDFAGAAERDWQCLLLESRTGRPFWTRCAARDWPTQHPARDLRLTPLSLRHAQESLDKNKFVMRLGKTSPARRIFCKTLIAFAWGELLDILHKAGGVD